MSRVKIISIVPYKILPAKLGGEKGIALFNEYLGRLIPITAITTKNNDVAQARNYEVLNILSNSRIRYVNIFLYFSIKRIIKEQGATHLLIEHPYFGWLAWMIRRTLPVTWIVHSHNIEYMRSKSIGRWWWKVLKWYEAWVYKKSDINFFISEDDLNHAVRKLNVTAAKSYTVTYGVEYDSVPDDIEICKEKIRHEYNIAPSEKILLFNGALYHHTNYDALSVILEKINPGLIEKRLSYKIIICGKGLPEFFEELKDYKDKNIIYAGFVDDISAYFKAADIFLNPILSGGGVKTKAIEAIAMNCTVVSTEIGALGLKREVCGKKLHVVENNDWQSFLQKVIKVINFTDNTPFKFFEYYYWGNIAEKVKRIIENKKAPDVSGA